MPRYRHLHPQGPTRSVFGCAERAISQLQSYGTKRILRDGDAEHHQVPERSVLSIPLSAALVVPWALDASGQALVYVYARETREQADLAKDYIKSLKKEANIVYPAGKEPQTSSTVSKTKQNQPKTEEPEKPENKPATE